VDFKTNRAVGRRFCKHLSGFRMSGDRQAALRLRRELLRGRERCRFE